MRNGFWLVVMIMLCGGLIPAALAEEDTAKLTPTHQGLHQDLKDAGCDPKWLDEVMWENGLEVKDLRRLWKPVKYHPAKCKDTPPPEIADASMDDLHNDFVLHSDMAKPANTRSRDSIRISDRPINAEAKIGTKSAARTAAAAQTAISASSFLDGTVPREIIGTGNATPPKQATTKTADASATKPPAQTEMPAKPATPTPPAISRSATLTKADSDGIDLLMANDKLNQTIQDLEVTLATKESAVRRMLSTYVFSLAMEAVFFIGLGYALWHFNLFPQREKKLPTDGKLRLKITALEQQESYFADSIRKSICFDKIVQLRRNDRPYPFLPAQVACEQDPDGIFVHHYQCPECKKNVTVADGGNDTAACEEHLERDCPAFHSAPALEAPLESALAS